MNFKKLGLFFLAFVIIFTLGACQAQQPQGGQGTSTNQPSKAGTLLNGAGSSFVHPLVEKAKGGYEQKSGVKINYQPIGSGGGIKQLTEKTVDFAASDAPMKQDEIQKAGGNVLHIPVTLGGVAITYNLEGVKDLKLTSDVIAEIYTGKITKWNDKKITDLNPGVTLPDTTIAPVYRSEGSGTTYIFTSYMNAAVPSIWTDKMVDKNMVMDNVTSAISAKGNAGVAAQIQNAKNTIGYVELAYVIQNNMSSALVKNKDGNFVTPSLDTVTAAAAGAAQSFQNDMKSSLVNQPGKDAYPIVGTTWALVYEKSPLDQAKTKQVVDFIKYLVTDGQQYSKDLGYAPLPKEIQDLDLKELDKVQAK
ncbi:phosphate ABC transporter substrate-binding protein PstS [Tepidibacillus marianensis]|uniref:phosphate ABC transporter substrate-binding protein PstS n=1 Tax=Tepidibacillus marianensis TaxID=3131995 RepID=UPI0030D442A2